jgi:hypothetical protein
MKNIIIITLALLSIATPAIAQVNRTVGDRVSNLGFVLATNNREAVKACRAKGGNIIVKRGSSYTCFYYQGLAK